MGDEFISTEHVLLGMLEQQDDAARLLKEAGLTVEGVKAALKDLRGAQRVMDQEPESKMNTLEKYGLDLTAEAEAGKLDPVIGRDQEIRLVADR